MKKLIYYLIVLCVAFYVFYLYYLFTRFDALFLTRSTSATPENRQDIFKSGKSYKLLNASKDLFQSAAHLKIPITVIDNDFLKYFLLSRKNEASSKVSLLCHYFCRDVNFLTVATEDRFWHEDNETILKLMSHFNVTINGNEELFKLKNNQPKSRHIILQHLQTAVIFHLVVFHRIDADYFWFDQIDLKSVTVLDVVEHLDYGKSYPGVFNKWNLETIKVHVDTLNIRIPANVSEFLHSKENSRFIMCNETIKKIFQQVNQITPDQKFKSTNPDGFQSRAANILKIVSKALNSIHVPFWLSSGTCLGWYRQCELFDHSRDVDVGVWIRDYSPLILESLQMEGMIPAFSYGLVKDSLELVFYNDNMKLDVFFFYEEVHHVWNGGTDISNDTKYKYIFNKFNLCWTHFLGMYLRVPCNTELYIRNNYGDDWIQLVTKWDWRISPNNVVWNGVWSNAERADAIKSLL